MGKKMLVHITPERIDQYRCRMREIRNSETGLGYIEHPIQVALRIQTGGFWQMTRFEVWATESFCDYNQIPEAE